MTLAVGLDVGGTKVLGAVVDVARGMVMREAREATRPDRGGEAVLETCQDLVRALTVDLSHPIMGVGVGVPEIVDSTGAIRSAVTIDWRRLDVANTLARVADGAPVVIDADVRAAAVAEGRFGSGRGMPWWLYVNAGTGISAAIVSQDRPVTGTHGGALVLGAPPVEEVAGGLALAREAGVDRVEDALRTPSGQKAVATAGAELGRTLAVIVNLVDPAGVVLGGGLGGLDGYRAAAEEALRAHVWNPLHGQITITAAHLGERAGAIGAACIAADHPERDV